MYKNRARARLSCYDVTFLIVLNCDISTLCSPTPLLRFLYYYKFQQLFSIDDMSFFINLLTIITPHIYYKLSLDFHRFILINNVTFQVY